MAFGLLGGVNSVVAGNHYLEITTDEAKEYAWDSQFYYQLNTPLKASTTYVLTMDVKCSKAFHLDFWPHESTSSKCIYKGYDVDTEWKSYKCEFETGECAADRIRWCFGTLQGKLYFDNINLVEKGETSNLLSGSDFETALDVHWTASSGVDYSIYETAATPTRCFKFVNTTAKANQYESKVKYDLDNALTSGKKYTLTMRAKATEAFSIPFWPAQSGGATTYTGYNIGTEWGDCSCTFTASDNHTFLQWCIGDKTNCTVWFDDMELKEEGSSTNLIVNGSFEGPMVPNWGDFGYHKPDYYGLEITYPAVEATPVEVALAKSLFKSWDKADGFDAVVTSNDPYWDAVGCGENLAAGAVVYGSGNVSYLDYADLSAYSGLKIYGTGNSVRVMFNRQGDDPTQPEVLYVSPTVEGTFVDISSYLTTPGYFHLNAIKVNWGETSTITAVKLLDPNSGEYVISGDLKDGKSNTSLTTALADDNAKYIDLTGTTGSGIGLVSANPNCLFVANAGTLSNDHNVIVGTTCDNLVLADNHPFKAPFDFTATAATYNTTINTTAQAGTLYLPYAAAIPAGVDAWTLTYSGGANVTATKITTGIIPANTPVLLNGSGSKDFTGSSVAIDADATNVSGALTGVFEQGYVPKDSYVLQNKSGVLAFYKVAAENSVTIKPFRAYLTASAGARLYIDFDDDETTGITNNKCETTSNNRYFDLQGREVAQPTTGLYIVNGKKVLVK